MSEAYNRASTGIAGLDRVVDGLRLGDNVVWQVDSLEDYRKVAQPFFARARAEGRRLVYVRYGLHPPVITDLAGVEVARVDPALGFEAFAPAVHQLIAERGTLAFYVFDCLTDLLPHWRSDLAVMNFFKVTCPFLYDLDTVAYFPLIRGEHTYTTIAGIRETTQLLLDLYGIDDETYVHPLKVWSRHSPTMFFPHVIAGDEVEPITSSEASSRLFARMSHNIDPPDHWRVLIEQGFDALHATGPGAQAQREEARELLLAMLIGRESRMLGLCRRYLSLEDLLSAASREIGTGFIGGKSVGMLVARGILGKDPQGRFAGRIEEHDSYFLGSDLFYTYVVANGMWRLWMEQKTPEGYFPAGARLHEALAQGRFPPSIREQFVRMLEYFGQSPVIVRSSSLLEDNFGNAFAGKYESIFCAGQGTPEDRYRRFEDAVRAVYASAMSPEALTYRRNRGLSELDEQMAVLVQRVSGDHHGDMFFPHAGGVGNSSNLYVWERDIDSDAGMLRLVFGLGTRAVDRTHEDYARIVTLDDPLRRRGVAQGEERRYSQRFVDVLSLSENELVTVPLTRILGGVRGAPRGDIGADWDLFCSPDESALRRYRELGRQPASTPVICDLQGLLARTDFGAVMRDALAVLSSAYDYPVDIEFTVNIRRDGEYRFNLVQCRPLQTRGLGKAVTMPGDADPAGSLFTSRGNFMGGNVRLPIEYAVLVKPREYLALGHQERYSVARLLGEVTRAAGDRNVMLLGPGRWGTSTPALGVPVAFPDVAGAAALVEFTYPDGDFRPELSYGSHFFQDIVESGTFYAALFDEQPGVVFNPGQITGRPNAVRELVPGVPATMAQVVHVARYPALVLYSDIVSQQLICR